MTDNVAIPGAVIRTVSNGTNQTQVVKLDIGGEAGESLVTPANPIPVSIVSGGGFALSDTVLTDDSGAQFLMRDNGSGFSYATLSGNAYTPSTNIRSSQTVGGATATNQTAGNTSLTAIATAQGAGGTGIAEPTGGTGLLGWLSGIYQKLASSIAVTGTFWQATQPVSAASLPLPTGAAVESGGNLASLVTLHSAGNTIASAGSTSALQTAGNASLTTIATNTASLSTSALQTAGNASLTTLATNLPAKGVALVTASTPVTESAITGVVAVTVGTTYAVGRQLLINCSIAGNVSVTFQDTSVLIFPVNAGLTILPWAITSVTTANTTATATYAILK